MNKAVLYEKFIIHNWVGNGLDFFFEQHHKPFIAGVAIESISVGNGNAMQSLIRIYLLFVGCLFATISLRTPKKSVYIKRVAWSAM